MNVNDLYDVEAGNVYVGDVILWPGDIFHTVTGVDCDPERLGVVILTTDMHPGGTEFRSTDVLTGVRPSKP